MNRVKSQEARAKRQRVGLLMLTLNPQPSTLNPSGATLSEVLISLMVMSIGVLAAAALIPISIIRSVQATQLTNGTIHRLNAEQLIDLFPLLVHNPDYNAAPSVHSTEKYIVDPLGTLQMPTTPVTTDDLRLRFGNNNGENTTFSSRFPKRYSGSVNLISNLSLNDIGYSPDTWQLFTKGTSFSVVTNKPPQSPPPLPVPTPTTETVVSFPGVDLTDLSNAVSSGIVARITLYSRNGRQSVTRVVTRADATARTVTWFDQDFPNNNQFFNDANGNNICDAGESTLSRFRLEMYDPRYSWVLTVRKTINPQNDVGDASVDVVIFHKRAFSAASEQCFFVTKTTIPPTTGPLPPSTIAVNPGDTTITLDRTNYSNPIKPFLKRGGFIFDLQNAHWYRIVQYTDDANPIITLDRPAASMIVGTDNTGHPVPAILAMPGVVEVYPLGSILYNSNNPPNHP